MSDHTDKGFIDLPSFLRWDDDRAEQVIHTCHWPGCNRRVPPKLWGCKTHWYKLPLRLRNAVWREYRPGQEISKTPTAKYVEVAKEVQEWIRTSAV